jgi:hypothetical protein
MKPASFQSSIELFIAFTDLRTKFWIQEHLLKILPYRPLFVLPATEPAAGDRTVVVSSAAVGLPGQMSAITISIMSYQVGSAELPANDPLLHILPRKREGDLAADCLAYTQMCKAVDLSMVSEGVFVLLWFLVEKPYPAFFKLTHQALSHMPFPLVQLLNRDNPLFAQNLDQGIEERRSLEGISGDVGDAGMSIKEAGRKVILYRRDQLPKTIVHGLYLPFNSSNIIAVSRTTLTLQTPAFKKQDTSSFCSLQFSSKRNPQSTIFLFAFAIFQDLIH